MEDSSDVGRLLNEGRSVLSSTELAPNGIYKEYVCDLVCERIPLFHLCCIVGVGRKRWTFKVHLCSNCYRNLLLHKETEGKKQQHNLLI